MIIPKLSAVEFIFLACKMANKWEMGRKALPDSIKILRGTDQPARMGGDISSGSVITKLPPVPFWFNLSGKKIYRDKGKLFMDLKILKPENLELFVSYVNQLGIHFECEIELSKTDRIHELTSKGGNYSQIKALQKLSNEALGKALKIAVEFGLTPAAATRVKMPKEKIKNDFENFING